MLHIVIISVFLTLAEPTGGLSIISNSTFGNNSATDSMFVYNSTSDSAFSHNNTIDSTAGYNNTFGSAPELNESTSSTPLKHQPPRLVDTTDVQDARFDIVVIVTDRVDRLTGHLSILQEPLINYSRSDSAIETEPVLVLCGEVPSGRMIFSPTGPIDRDQDDVRRFADAAKKGIKRAIKTGAKRPLLVRPNGSDYEWATVVAALAALETLYTPLQLREAGKPPKAEILGIWCQDKAKANRGIPLIQAMETGRILARDIAGSDPERMAPPKVLYYLQNSFRNSSVKMSVVSDVNTLNKDYPLLGAVNRAANTVERHQGKLIYLEYTGSGNITKTLFLVGKGITFDTGGVNIKRGGGMKGMSRDKSGAAAVAGFLKVLSIMKPKNLKVVAGLPMVRNSIGEDSYVPDEIITSRAGVRVRVGNTDAEGRMVMADVLCRMKEKALAAVNPHLMTIATLTGHVGMAVGNQYTAVMDNGPAQAKNASGILKAAGEIFGDPFEISTIRPEDYTNHMGESEDEDIKQLGKKFQRGHQGPAAFLIMASGLDKHGKDSASPLPYSHMDIAGSAKLLPHTPSARPVIALSGLYIFGKH